MSKTKEKPRLERRCSKRTGAVRKIAGPAAKFPGKLHALLDYVEREGLEHIISWIRDGTAFKVHDPEKLVDRVLPIFFGQTMYRSFQRQLSMWHFHKICIGFDRGAFLHPYFKRGDKTLCAKMSRNISDQPHSLLLEDDQLLLDFGVLGTDSVDVENRSIDEPGQDSVECQNGILPNSSFKCGPPMFKTALPLPGPVISSCSLKLDRSSLSDGEWHENGNELQSELASIKSLLGEMNPTVDEGFTAPGSYSRRQLKLVTSNSSSEDDWSMPRPIECMMGRVVPSSERNLRSLSELIDSSSVCSSLFKDALVEGDPFFDQGRVIW